LTLEDKMHKIEEEIKRCTKCSLWKKRTNAVPGEGNYQAEIMFIGEAPGRYEDLQGRPFVGAAGKLLTSLIEDIGLTRADVYITNVVKCRPPNNRDPKPEEISACSPYLVRQISLIKPKLLVTLGRHSTKFILEKIGVKASGITKVRGTLFEGEINGVPVKVLPTYHPAAALYNPALKDTLQADFRKILEIIKEKNQVKKGVTLDFFLKSDR